MNETKFRPAAHHHKHFQVVSYCMLQLTDLEYSLDLLLSPEEQEVCELLAHLFVVLSESVI